MFNRFNSMPKRDLCSFEMDKVVSVLKEDGGNHLSHLTFLKDKEIFWAQEQTVFILYKRILNKVIVLGDPIGDESKIQGAIKEFCAFSKDKGLKPVFYQISAEYMQHYHDSGYRFIKLGEEGRVDLNQFTLEGKQVSKLRTSRNKFTRMGYSFEVIHPPYSCRQMAELKRISDSWRGDQKEKGFSVASFSEEYVTQFPIALLKDEEGNAAAFATLATDYKGTISIDLMRKSTDSPAGTMDVLFVYIFTWAKENGHQACSLGMSPLANVGKCRQSFMSEKLMHLAYLYGNSYYNFKGLKEFKGKFASNWEPKYLAYNKALLPVTLLQVVLLINNSKPVESKYAVKNNFILNALRMAIKLR